MKRKREGLIKFPNKKRKNQITMIEKQKKLYLQVLEPNQFERYRYEKYTRSKFNHFIKIKSIRKDKHFISKLIKEYIGLIVSKSIENHGKVTCENMIKVIEEHRDYFL